VKRTSLVIARRCFHPFFVFRFALQEKNIKAKMDYEQRLERIKSGAEDRRDRGIRNRKNTMASKTNKEKEKLKPFKMAQHAPKVTIKKKRSLKEIRTRQKKNEKREIKFKIRRGY
jgi:hypothetical protein